MVKQKNMLLDEVVNKCIITHSEAMGFTQKAYIELLVFTVEDAFQKLKELYPEYANSSIFRTMRHEMFDKMTPPSHIVKNIEWAGGIKE